MTRTKDARARERTVDTAVIWRVNPGRNAEGSAVVTVKAGIRRALGWEIGDEVSLQVTKGGALVVRRVS